MIRLSLAAVLALAVACVLASRLGGAQGAGVLLGYSLGAGLSGLGCLYLRHAMATRPERALAATVVSFLVKLAALLIGALAFKYVDAAAARVDWRTFTLAFAGAVALVLPIGTWEAVRARRPGLRAGVATR